jgi:NAD(P)-dependent dehydrogenase (short-subunit alcohol dehydrogenase family)
MPVSPCRFNFADRVALVTGGGPRIGRAISLLFAQRGAKVVIGHISAKGREAVEMIQEAGGNSLFVETDVRDAKQLEHLVATAVENLRGNPLCV